MASVPRRQADEGSPAASDSRTGRGWRGLGDAYCQCRVHVPVFILSKRLMAAPQPVG